MLCICCLRLPSTFCWLVLQLAGSLLHSLLDSMWYKKNPQQITIIRVWARKKTIAYSVRDQCSLRYPWKDCSAGGRDQSPWVAAPRHTDNRPTLNLAVLSLRLNRRLASPQKPAASGVGKILRQTRQTTIATLRQIISCCANKSVPFRPVGRSGSGHLLWDAAIRSTCQLASDGGGGGGGSLYEKTKRRTCRTVH